MTTIYRIRNGDTISPDMSLAYSGLVAQVIYTDNNGQEVTPTGEARLFRRAGTHWVEEFQYAIDEWRFNGGCSSVRIDLSNVSGFDRYEVIIWRTPHMVSQTPSGAYTGESGAVTQSYIEINAKRGVQYEASRRVTGLTTSQTLDSVFLTGDKPAILKQRLFSFTGDGLIASIYESPTYTGGVADPYYNLSRINPTAGDVTLLAGGTLNVTAVGTKAFADDFFIAGGTGATRGGSLRPTGAERILKPNTAYLLRQTMLSNQDISAYITWYSGRLDAPFTRPTE
jgi:hypothetical protein